MIIRRGIVIPLAALAAAVGAIGGCAAGTLPLDAGWADDPVWDDGLAEVAVYDASRVIYGAPRPYRAVLLTVKEDFDRDRLVKADPPYDDRPIVTVLKQNAVREIATPNYDYRIMTSTFVERAAPWNLVKLTSGSHEWCGNTWKSVRQRDGRAVYAWESYFDGEVDGSQELTLDAQSLLEDQLPLTLRGLEFAAGVAGDLRLLPSMATTHGGPARWGQATLRVVGRDEVGVPAGTVDAWRVDVKLADRSASYWFDASGTHPLVRMETSDGESLELRSIERRAYWRLGG